MFVRIGDDLGQGGHARDSEEDGKRLHAKKDEGSGSA
jgi:hypothetical protein